jgi:hypothetical protein
MPGICKPFQVNFHVLPFKNHQNTSRFVTLFSAHGDVVVGFAIFHIAYSKKKEKREKKKEKNRATPPWNVNVGGHPMESVSLMIVLLDRMVSLDYFLRFVGPSSNMISTDCVMNFGIARLIFKVSMTLLSR